MRASNAERNLGVIAEMDQLGRELAADGARGPEGRAPDRGNPTRRSFVADLEARRRKLLALYYDDKIGLDLFAEEVSRRRRQLDAARSESDEADRVAPQATDVAVRFEEVAALLAEFDIEATWDAATTDERRVLVQELVEEVALFPDHLEVSVAGAPGST